MHREETSSEAVLPASAITGDFQQVRIDHLNDDEARTGAAQTSFADRRGAATVGECVAALRSGGFLD
jgi:hypothetical protein